MSAVRDCGPRELSRFSVLETIANYADVFGFCWPGIELIATESRCDERTVRRQIVELEREGWLHVARKVLNGKANVYQINLGKLGVTVPDDAKRDPLFIRLLKRYPDTMSPIFWSEKSPDTDHFSEDNPQPLTGQPEPSQRTLEGGSADKLCPPNRYNHQEPPKEPSPWNHSPLPPSRGVTSLPSERWSGFLTRLKSDLALVPATFAGGRLHELVPGENDFDAAFRDWWLEDLVCRDDGWMFLTAAVDAALTRRGVEKYRKRIERIAHEVFSIPQRQQISFRVREPETETLNPAA